MPSGLIASAGSGNESKCAPRRDCTTRSRNGRTCLIALESIKQSALATTRPRRRDPFHLLPLQTMQHEYTSNLQSSDHHLHPKIQSRQRLRCAYCHQVRLVPGYYESSKQQPYRTSLLDHNRKYSAGETPQTLKRCDHVNLRSHRSVTVTSPQHPELTIKATQPRCIAA